MKHTYIAPECEALDCSVSDVLMLSETVGINNDNEGGDDGFGGYDPDGSLAREQRLFHKNLWDNAW